MQNRNRILVAVVAAGLTLSASPADAKQVFRNHGRPHAAIAAATPQVAPQDAHLGTTCTISEDQFHQVQHQRGWTLAEVSAFVGCDPAYVERGGNRVRYGYDADPDWATVAYLDFRDGLFDHAVHQ